MVRKAHCSRPAEGPRVISSPGAANPRRGETRTAGLPAQELVQKETNGIHARRLHALAPGVRRPLLGGRALAWQHAGQPAARLGPAVRAPDRARARRRPPLVREPEPAGGPHGRRIPAARPPARAAGRRPAAERARVRHHRVRADARRRDPRVLPALAPRVRGARARAGHPGRRVRRSLDVPGLRPHGDGGGHRGPMAIPAAGVHPRCAGRVVPVRRSDDRPVGLPVLPAGLHRRRARAGACAERRPGGVLPALRRYLRRCRRGSQARSAHPRRLRLPGAGRR